MTGYNELRDGQEFYGNGYKKGYEDAKKEYARPQGDCISREALKEQINATDFDFGDYYDNTEEIRKRVCEAIDNAQAVYEENKPKENGKDT